MGRHIVDPNPEEASMIKRIVGENGFAIVNLGDRQALIEILDGQDAQQVLDAMMADPKEAERTRESIRQQRLGQAVSLAEIKKKYLRG